MMAISDPRSSLACPAHCAGVSGNAIPSLPSKPSSRRASDSIVVTGYVPDLADYYQSCRVFVAPLRFGAGISYKLTEAMSHGIPSVVSPLVAEGLMLTDGDSMRYSCGSWIV